MSILCGQQNGCSVIYMLNIRNNYSHYCLITTNSDPPTSSDMASPATERGLLAPKIFS